MAKLVLLGGGENGHHHTNYETAPFDREIVSLTNKQTPNFLFIGLANKYPDYYYEIMEGIYADKYGCSPCHLTYADMQSPIIAQNKIDNADIIYVGGGNTLHLMRLFRKYGIDKMLEEASNKDKVFCGVSAGAICFCKYGQSDARENRSTRVTGLGFVPLAFCPHILTEPQRVEYLKSMMKTTYRIPAVALDRAALEIVNGNYRILFLEDYSKADKCYWKNGTYHIEDIKSDVWKSTKSLYQK